MTFDDEKYLFDVPCLTVIPTVDWASWEDKVPADQLAEIKANYEALTFPAPQASNNGAVMEDFVAKYVRGGFMLKQCLLQLVQLCLTEVCESMVSRLVA